MSQRLVDQYPVDTRVEIRHGDGRFWGKLKLSLDLDHEYNAAGISMAVTENNGVSYPQTWPIQGRSFRPIQRLTRDQQRRGQYRSR